MRDGVLPAWVATDAPGFRAAGEAVPRGQRRIQVAGFDVVRDRDGRWLVLEDNVRVPSGVAYAIACRRLLRAACPELFGAADLHDPEEAPALLRQRAGRIRPAARAGHAAALPAHVGARRLGVLRAPLAGHGDGRSRW